MRVLHRIAPDIRAAVRRLWRDRLTSAAIVLTLGAGVGVAAAVGTLLDDLLVRPPEAVIDAAHLYVLRVTERLSAHRRSVRPVVTYPEFTDLRRRLAPLAKLAAYADPDSARLESRAGLGVHAGYTAVSAAYFARLGIHPALGRFFTRDESEGSHAAPVAVIGQAVARHLFGTARAAVGRTVRIDGIPFHVIGIAPSAFTGLDARAVDVWLPLAGAIPAGLASGASQGYDYRVIGRLAPGVARRTVAAAASASLRATAKSQGTPPLGAQASLVSVTAARASDLPSGDRLPLLAGAVSAALLLIACGNAALLLLSRAIQHTTDTAVRIALGASRGRIAAQAVTEAAILAIIGGGIALTVATVESRSIQAVLLPGLGWRARPMDLRTVVLDAAVVLITVVLASIPSVMQAIRSAPLVALSAGSSRITGAAMRWQRSLLAAQAAMAFALLVAGGLLVQSLRHALNIDLGLDAPHLIAVSLERPLTAPARPFSLDRWADIEARARRLPNVVSTSLSSTIPLATSEMVPLRVPGLDSIPAPGGVGPVVAAVGAGYFATAGTRILRGRAFGPRDKVGAQDVVIVDRTMAHALWPGRDPIGRYVEIGGTRMRETEVIGVAEDAHVTSIREAPAMEFYVPAAQRPDLARPGYLLARYRGRASLAISELREVVQSAVRGRFASVRVARIDAPLASQRLPWKRAATLLSLFAAMAIVVTGGGLFAVAGFAVARRAREFGLRSALGALPSDIGWLVFGDALKSCAVGAGVGVILALAAGQLLRPLLFGATPFSPVPYLVAAIVLVLVAVASSAAPIRRATRVDLRTVLDAE